MNRFICYALCGLFVWQVEPRTVTAQSDQAQITSIATLPRIAIAEFQNAVIPGSLVNDRQIRVGAIGSDLWQIPNGDKLEFWMLTDRGPNGRVEIDGEKRRTFPVPEFNPMLVRAVVRDGAIDIVQALPLAGRNGQRVNGLPNFPDDEAAYDFTGKTKQAPDPRGVDPEGLVRTLKGDFWIAEEYGPSLLHLDAQGRIIARYVPEGLQLTGVEYTVAATLPAIYRRRQKNRGFEGLAISADERLLYLVMESPLTNSDGTPNEASRNARILVFDMGAERRTAEFVYRLEPADQFGGGAKAKDMKVSAATVIGPNRLLVLERTDTVSKVFAIDLNKATNLLSTQWHAASGGGQILEAAADLTAAGIQPPEKALVVDLSALPGMPVKIEGLVVIDPQTIVVSNDNDFDVGRFDQAGNNVGEGLESKVVVIRLAKPL